MATYHNRRRVSSYPDADMFNQRENRLVDHAHTLLVSSAESVALSDTDGVSFVRNAGVSTVTLPPAASCKGRVISFLQVDANTLTIGQNADGANIDGADADFTALDAADDWAELFCTGSEWIILKQHIA